MKNKNILLAAFLTLASILPLSFVKGQEKSESSEIKVTADLVSSYVWRGVVSSAVPNIQPTLAFVKGNFEIGAWGSTDLNFVTNYREVDLYASYAFGPVKFTLTDYNWNFKKSYFNYKNKETDHIFEGTVGYTGPESLPISIAASVMFAGADKKFNKDSAAIASPSQAYSTYVEFGYAFKKFNVFMGVTPSDGYYGDSYGNVGGFAVVNFGASASKNLKISDSFSLPLKATLGFNPQKEDVYMVFGITF